VTILVERPRRIDCYGSSSDGSGNGYGWMTASDTAMKSSATIAIGTPALPVLATSFFAMADSFRLSVNPTKRRQIYQANRGSVADGIVGALWKSKTAKRKSPPHRNNPAGSATMRRA